MYKLMNLKTGWLKKKYLYPCWVCKITSHLEVIVLTFWDEVKDTFWNSYCKKHKKELSISKRQAIIKIIEKKDKDKEL